MRTSQIVDLDSRAVFAHEALVRGPEGEGAMTVLSQVNEKNRYRVDQACRVKVIRQAAELGIRERISINFLANAVYQPELCVRTTLEAARVHRSRSSRSSSKSPKASGWKTVRGSRRSCANTSAAGS